MYKQSPLASSDTTFLIDVKADKAVISALLRKVNDFLFKTLHRRFEGYRVTPHLVQFKFDEKIDVDLLLSRRWSSREEFYDFLKNLHPDSRYE